MQLYLLDLSVCLSIIYSFILFRTGGDGRTERKETDGRTERAETDGATGDGRTERGFSWPQRKKQCGGGRQTESFRLIIPWG